MHYDEYEDDGIIFTDMEERPRPSARRNPRTTPKKSVSHGVIVGLGIAAAILLATYIVGAFHFRTHFLPRTTLNGASVSGKSAAATEDMIASEVENYTLTLTLRDGGTATIAGSDIGLQAIFDGSIQELLAGQNSFSWPLSFFHSKELVSDTLLSYDTEALASSVAEQPAFSQAGLIAPENAHLSSFVAGMAFSIVPEVMGNTPNLPVLQVAVTTAVDHLQQNLDVDAAGGYLNPEITAEDPNLKLTLDFANQCATTTITYTFGSQTETVDGDMICSWMIENDGKMDLDDTQIANYVAELAKKYDTSGTTRSFNTSYGSQVSVSGPYGWKLDREAEAVELKAAILAGESGEREPVYTQTAATHDGNDYGNTYAEVNLTAQHMILYKDGAKVLESDFVSGCISKGTGTPAGIYPLTYKQKDAVLVGENYKTPVGFFMPFNGGIGFHDATWRSEYGGDIYKTNGSHGCLNMPYQSAVSLYNNVYSGMPVICYELAGTESTHTTDASGNLASDLSATEATTAPTEATTATDAVTITPEGYIMDTNGNLIDPATGLPVPSADSATTTPPVTENAAAGASQ